MASKKSGAKKAVKKPAAAKKPAAKKTAPIKKATAKKAAPAAKKPEKKAAVAPSKPKAEENKKTLGKKVALAGAAAAVAKKITPSKDYPFEDEEEGTFTEEGVETEELVEEESDEIDVEGPPPWWKDSPSGIEGAEEENGDRANFDDSDEWTEEDEDWSSSKKSSLDDFESSDGDDEERW